MQSLRLNDCMWLIPGGGGSVWVVSDKQISITLTGDTEVDK